jgi:hypothetical protein
VIAVRHLDELNRLMPVKFKDDDGNIARQLWERSEEMLARTSGPR